MEMIFIKYKINEQFQNKHSPEPDNKWVKFQLIERDICYLFHQLSSYSYIMADLYYDEIYNLPYWEYINIDINDIQDKEQCSFIREGCLILIFAMVIEAIEGAGSYVMDNLENIKNNLNNFKPSNKKEKKLYKIVSSAFEYIETNEEDLNLLDEQSVWIHKEYIRKYFEEKVNDFKKKYFNK